MKPVNNSELMKFENDMDKQEKFIHLIREKLPKDLEVHKITGDYGYWWEVRPKGFFLNLWRPSVGIEEYEKCFRIYRMKDVKLAMRLSKIFPDVEFKSKEPKIVKLLEDEKIQF